MKRKFLIPILIFSLLLGTLSGANASASVVVISENEHWSTEEMIAFDRLVMEEAENCHGNMDCITEINTRSHRIGGIWAAWRKFSDIHLRLTAINPAEGYVKILFRDRTFAGTVFQNYPADVLKEIYLVWFEEGYNREGISDIDPDTGESYASFVMEHKKDTKSPFAHYPYVEEDVENHLADLKPNQEYTLKVAGLEEIANANLTFYIRLGGGIDYWLKHDYSSCLNSPEYQASMECRLVYDDEDDMMMHSDVIFMPFWPDTPTDGYYQDPVKLYGDLLTGTGSDNSVSTNSSDQTQITPSDRTSGSEKTPQLSFATTTNKEQGTTSPQKSHEDNDDTEQLVTVSPAPLAEQNSTSPSVVSAAGECSDAPSAMWWWVLLLILAGDVLVMWWFWPKKSRQNCPKTH